MQKINESIETVLDFLKEIPLSTYTVNDYKIRYNTVRSFCKVNSLTMFSHRDAQAFTDMQNERYTNNQIGERHFRKLRRAAFLLADCMHGTELVWKNYVFPDKLLNKFLSTYLMSMKHIFQAIYLQVQCVE